MSWWPPQGHAGLPKPQVLQELSQAGPPPGIETHGLLSGGPSHRPSTHRCLSAAENTTAADAVSCHSGHQLASRLPCLSSSPLQCPKAAEYVPGAWPCAHVGNPTEAPGPVLAVTATSRWMGNPSLCVLAFPINKHSNRIFPMFPQQPGCPACTHRGPGEGPLTSAPILAPCTAPCHLPSATPRMLPSW